MKKLIVTEFVTLDGVMEAPGGEPTHAHTGWVHPFMGPDAGEFKSQEVFEAGCQLVGRVTYESFAGAWPTYEGPMAVRMNAMPKYVVSTTMATAEWTNTQVLPGLDAVRALKADDGGDILVPGSHTLVHALLHEGLVDELRLMIFPVTIGRGLKVFPETDAKTSYELTDTRAFDNGVVLNTYAVR
jgi:dihydrofolate reductase